MSFFTLENISNRFSCYPAVRAFIRPRNAVQEVAFRAISIAVSILTFGLATLASNWICQRFYSRNFTPQSRRDSSHIQNVSEPILTRMSPQAERLFQSITPFNDQEQEHAVAETMRNYTMVSPYKPCGSTDNILISALANYGCHQVPDPKGGTKASVSHAMMRARMPSVKESLARSFEKNKFDNVTAIEGNSETSRDFWACHPQTIFEICQSNPSLLKIPSNFDGDKAIVQHLIGELKTAVGARNAETVAQKFIELAQIANSLPENLFRIAFGDYSLGHVVHASVPEPLRQLQSLKDEFSDLEDDTITSICSYFYHKGSSNPSLDARSVLLNLQPGKYIVYQDVLLKMPHR